MPAEPEMEAVGATPVPKNEDPKGLYERNIEWLGATPVPIVEGPVAVETEIVGTNPEMDMYLTYCLYQVNGYPGLARLARAFQ
jgi:hypothetical protein